jgi:hypothetical protein
MCLDGWADFRAWRVPEAKRLKRKSRSRYLATGARGGGERMPKSDKPNILVIWGDDIGITNLSCYSDGLMGYRTPNIDRLAKEGMPRFPLTPGSLAPC